MAFELVNVISSAGMSSMSRVFYGVRFYIAARNFENKIFLLLPAVSMFFIQVVRN